MDRFVAADAGKVGERKRKPGRVRGASAWNQAASAIHVLRLARPSSCRGLPAGESHPSNTVRLQADREVRAGPVRHLGGADLSPSSPEYALDALLSVIVTESLTRGLARVFPNIHRESDP